MRDEIEELYGAMREREEASWDPLLRNYYAGYCDALGTVYSFLTSESGRRERTALRSIKKLTKAEETGKEPPEKPKEPLEKQKEQLEKQKEQPEEPKEPQEGPKEAGTASEEGRYLKVCKRCGREFRTNANQRKYCQECSEIRKKEAQKECIKRNRDRYTEIRKRRRAEEKKPEKKPTPKKTGPVEVRCKQCGKLISTDKSCRKKYCDECLRKRKTERKQLEREKLEAGFSFEKEDMEKQARTNTALNEAARIQKETGLSYGKQMAMKYMKEERR